MTTTLPPRSHTTPAVPLVELVLTQADLDRERWLAAHLDDVLRLRPQRVVVDLTGCERLDATSLHALLDAHRRLHRTGDLLELSGLSLRIREALGLSGLRHVFSVVPRRSAPGAAAAPPAPSSTDEPLTASAQLRRVSHRL